MGAQLQTPVPSAPVAATAPPPSVVTGGAAPGALPAGLTYQDIAWGSSDPAKRQALIDNGYWQYTGGGSNEGGGYVAPDFGQTIKGTFGGGIPDIKPEGWSDAMLRKFGDAGNHFIPVGGDRPVSALANQKAVWNDANYGPVTFSSNDQRGNGRQLLDILGPLAVTLITGGLGGPSLGAGLIKGVQGGLVSGKFNPIGAGMSLGQLLRGG